MLDLGINEMMSVVRRSQLSSGPLKQPLFNDNHEYILTIVSLVAAVLSAIVGLFAVFWFLRMKRLFRHK